MPVTYRTRRYSGSRSDATRASRVDVDSVDGTDVHTQHTVDTLFLVGRVGLDFALRVVGGVHPLEDVDGTVLQTGAVGETDIEVDGDVGAVDTERLRFLDGPPDVVTLVLFDDVTAGFEFRVYCHTLSSTLHLVNSSIGGGPDPTLSSRLPVLPVPGPRRFPDARRLSPRFLPLARSPWRTTRCRR